MTETLNLDLPPAIDHYVGVVLKEACERGLTLATAESCTGGLLASLLTDVEGCSHAFERAFVTYTDEAKHEMLGVPLELIREKGAVSQEVARAMAEGAVDRSRADVAIAITGFAGPGAPGEEPGLVHFALRRRGRETVAREVHFGDIGRGGVRLACLRTALEMLRRSIA